MSRNDTAATRLVVAFDPFAPHRAALELALRLASTGARSLHGLYVEETDALTLGSFPWAREIATATAEARPLQAQAVERGYTRRAAEARALFEATAGGVAGARFERVRGRLAEELRRFAADAYAVLMDWPPRGRRSRHQAAAVVRALLELPAPLIGLVEPRGAASTSIVVVSAAAAAGPARELAEQLAAPSSARITLVSSAATAAAIIECARTAMAGTVLVQRGGAAQDEQMLAELALEWSGSLLLLR